MSISEEGRKISTAVGIDKDKNSQSAVKWAIEKLRLKDNRIILVHVKIQHHAESHSSERGGSPRPRCCSRTLRVHQLEFYQDYRRWSIKPRRDSKVSDFCKVYAVNKGKMLKLKASKEPDTPNSATSSNSSGMQNSPDSSTPAKFRPQESWKSATSSDSYSDGGKNTPYFSSRDSQITPRDRPFGRIPSPHQQVNSNEFFQTMSAASVNNSSESMVIGGNSSSTNFSGPGDSMFGNMTPPRQPSTDISAVLHPMNNHNLHVRTKESPPYSMSSSDQSDDIRSFPSDVSFDVLDQNQFSYASRSSNNSQDDDNMLSQARGMINWKLEENNLDDAKHSQVSAMAMVEREMMKCNAAVEVAQKAQRIAELESEKRKRAEMKFRVESEERKKAVDALAHTEVQYRRYTMDEIQIATNYFSAADKVGEGGYGPVFQGTLDHTPVAIKVLRPDISQGEKQFQREVEVLSRMRHPNMVILLGACPEYGCLVYEYMDNGSLEDRLNRKNGSAPLSWQTRFRIAAEISTALNFLHRTRPEPLVHRDLKPANILLDRNNVSKISDVGLSRLVPPSVADSITQCCMTAAAGTFCYIDPEYQQIDPTVKDWPLQDTLSFAKLALRCCELRRRDRPDLDTEILHLRWIYQ